MTHRLAPPALTDRRRRRGIATATLAVAALTLAACADGGDAAAEEPGVRTDQVRVADDVFDAPHIEVDAGDTVTWTWDGRNAHDVVGDDFDSGVQTEGTFTHTFDEPGTYDYTCRLHGRMDGTVTVVEASG